MVKFFNNANAESNSVAVIGLGRFGRAVALELMAGGTEVLGVDASPKVVQELDNQLTHVACADATNSKALSQLGIDEFSKVVVAIGENLEASILVVSHLLKSGQGEVWAKAHTEGHGQILRQMGVKRVLFPESDMGRRAAHLVNHSLLDYFEIGYGYAMVAVKTPAQLVGKPLADSNLRRTRAITVIAVRDDDEGWVSAHAQTVLDEDDIVLMVGPVGSLDEFCEKK